MMDVEEKREGEEPVESEEGNRVTTAEGGELDEGIDVGHVGGSRESGQGGVEAIGEGDLEGETPVGNLERETPSENDEGETPAGEVDEGKAPGESEEEFPRENVEEVADDDDVGDEEKEPEKEGLKEIVDLDDGSEEEATPVDERTTRRTIRRSRMLEELEEPTKLRKLQFGESRDVGGTEEGDSKTEEKPETDEGIAQAEEKRLAAERKRKGKQEARPLAKKHKHASSTPAIDEPTPDTI